MFSDKTFDFLSRNSFENSRVWFNEHTDEYKQHVVKPLTLLAEQLAPVINGIDGLIVTDPRKAVSRIYCDMRYSKGKLYRDSVWLSFKRDKKAFPNFPEFFFAASGTMYCWGCGYYCAPTDTMERMRKLILSPDESFLRVKSFIDGQSDLVVDGETYKRSKYPEQSEELRSWLDRKSISVMRYGNGKELLYSDKLGDVVAHDMVLLKDTYGFFVKAHTEH